MKSLCVRAYKIITVVLMPMVLYFLLGPIEIYQANRKDFSFSVCDFAGWFLLAVMVCTVLASVIISLLPKTVRKLLCFAWFTFGVCSYLQYLLLNRKLSEPDGSPMDWGGMSGVTRINTIIWIVVIFCLMICCVTIKEKWEKVMFYGSAFLISVQIVAIVSLLLQGVGRADTSRLQLSGKDQFTISPSDNIIVFVLDTLGNTQLENAKISYPGMLSGLNDFTYYTNADCHYYCTFPSMTHMFTGNEFDFNATSNEWLSSSWESPRTSDFFERLHRLGYKCNLYSAELDYVYGGIDNLNGKFDNVEELECEVDTLHLLHLLARVSVYRCVPYLIKPYYETLTSSFSDVVKTKNGSNPIHDNVSFYKTLKNKRLIISDSESKLFIVEHLSGTHQPYITGADAEYLENGGVDESVAGCMHIIREYIDQLKQLNAYETSNIIITSDHGSWYGNDGQPIFFVKRAGENHSGMLENNAPISHDDFQATILSLLGEKSSDYGKSIWEWREGERREREVYMRMDDKNYPKVKGSSFNTYYGYFYDTDKSELISTVGDGPDIILPATPWE